MSSGSMDVHLRYGLNPEQHATASLDAPESPLRVVAGQPSLINLLDALGAWRLTREASSVLQAPVAASFKHTSPAGAAAAGPLDAVMTGRWIPAGTNPSPITTAYIRARDCDPRSSFGDFVAVSEPVDHSLAEVLRGVVSDGIIGPGFESGTTEILAAKKSGTYLVLEVDPGYEGPRWEAREAFGLRLDHEAVQTPITPDALRAGAIAQLPDSAVRDLMLAMVTARHTQSNSVTYARDGMVLGIGAGQQSRIDCTRLAGAKVDTWWLRRHHKVRHLPFREAVRRQERINWEIRYLEADLNPGESARFCAALTTDPVHFTAEERLEWISQLNDVAVASDGYIPFRDNIDQAARHGVRYIADPGGSSRSQEVDDACHEHGIALTTTGIRLFLH